MARTQLQLAPDAELETGTLTVEAYLKRVRAGLADLSAAERETLLEQARAHVDLALELDRADRGSAGEVSYALERLATPEELALRLRTEAGVTEGVPATESEAEPQGLLAPCRSCKREVSREAVTCPQCGAPFPTRKQWQGKGYEWKSPRTVFGLPLVHIAYGRDKNGKMRVAKGIIAIGQFGVGVFTLAQFGVAAVFGIGQFMLAPIAVGQIAIGLFCAGQLAFGLLGGVGQIASGLLARLDMFTWKHWFPPK